MAKLKISHFIILFLVFIFLLISVYIIKPDFGSKDDCEEIAFMPADFELRESTIDLKKDVFAKGKTFLVVDENTYINYFNALPEELDLEKFIYIFVFDEGKSNSGYEVHISKVCVSTQDLVIEVYVDFASSKSRYALDVISRPEIGIKIPKMELSKVKFIDKKDTVLFTWEIANIMNTKFFMLSFIILLSCLILLLFSNYTLLVISARVILTILKRRLYPIKKEFLWWLLICFSSALVEIVLVNIGGHWTYAHKHIWNIPLWMPFFWGLLGTSIVSLYQSFTLK